MTKCSYPGCNGKGLIIASSGNFDKVCPKCKGTGRQ